MLQLSISPGTSFDFTQRVTLDGVEVLLRFRWLPRPFAWYASLALADGTPVADGFRVTPGSALVPTTQTDGLPPGKLFVLGPDPYTFDQLGAQVTVYYATADEVEANPNSLGLL